MRCELKVAYVLIPCCLVVGLVAGPVLGQVASSGSSDRSGVIPRFQVATIKPSRPEEARTVQIQGNRFATTDTSLVDLLKYAYGLHEQEIVGGPQWMQTQAFDVIGDPEEQNRPSSDEFKKMVQALLADRFHLAGHHETRDLPVFDLVPAKSGTRLSKSVRPPDGIPTVSYLPGRLTVGNATMADFAAFLQRFVADRPVFDGTGVTGKYDLTLRWAPDELEAGGNRQGDDNTSSLPGLYTAIQEQLGLKLQEEKRPAQVFVVDRIEMPSEN